MMQRTANEIKNYRHDNGRLWRRIIGGVCAIFGVLIVALPVSVIGNNLSTYYSHAQARISLPKKKRRLICEAKRLFRKRGVRSAECGVRSAECGVRSAECGVRSAECGVRSAECGVRSAECGVRSAECGVRSAECGV